MLQAYGALEFRLDESVGCRFHQYTRRQVLMAQLWLYRPCCGAATLCHSNALILAPLLILCDCPHHLSTLCMLDGCH